MKNNIIKYVFFILIALLLIFAVYKVNTNKSDKKNDEISTKESQEQTIDTEITLAIAELDSINPIISKNQNVQDVSRLIYEPLVNLSNDYKAEPCLAVEWAKTDDNKAYIIKLRENVTWSNGENFTANDVRFTIDRLKENESIYSYNVQYVIGVDVIDDYTVKITLDKEIPFFEYNLTFPIMSESYYKDEDFTKTEKNNSPIGTGMFKIAENKGSNIILNKNENWWNKENKNSILQTITININSTMAEVYNSFKMGNVDLVSTQNLNYTDYIGTIGYSTKEYSGRQHGFIAINTKNEILSNVEVRQAISYAIDKGNIVSNVFGDKFYTAETPLSYGNWLYDNEGEKSTFNLETSNKVLQENGWTFGTKYWRKTINHQTKRIQLDLVVKKSDQNKVNIANAIKEQLAKAGIDVNINGVSDSKYSEYINKKNYDLILAETTVSASPDLSTYFGNNNLANYTNDEVTNIMQEVSNTTDENVLKEKYKRLQEIYIKDVPYISLYTNKNVVAYTTDLAGEVSSNWFNLFYNIENWYK